MNAFGIAYDGADMILAKLKLPSRANQCWQYSGIDSPDDCLDKNHFFSYSHEVIYNYNSRGFRDDEWSDNIQELQNSIWCIGDSFTVGIGSPLEHTWPYILSQKLNQRTINVSMDGASNDWISRVSQMIAREINPRNIVIMWSYLHRREHSDDTLDDENRRCQYSRTTEEEDIENFESCIKSLDVLQCNIVQTAIPYFSTSSLAHPGIEHIMSHWKSIRGESWPKFPPMSTKAFDSLPNWILEEMKSVHKCLYDLRHQIETLEKNQHKIPDNSVDANKKHKFENIVNSSIIEVPRLDIARDGHHFDIVTSLWISEKVLPFLIVS
jgi:hypothetical protein